MFSSLSSHPLISCGNSSSSKVQIFAENDVVSPEVNKPGRRSHAGSDEDKVAKLLRERNTAQKRRQSKREELGKLSSIVQELEAKLSKLRGRLSTLSELERQQVQAAQARAGNQPLGCRLCCILDRREEFATLERLVHHFKVHHASELRQKREDFNLEMYATQVPTEDCQDLSDNEDNDSDEGGASDELVKSSSVDTLTELKRRLRLKRNAASARKSRKRKRVQLERWRMILPSLRFQVETLEKALASVGVTPRVYRFDAEPDVVSAAFALIGCSLSTSNQ